MGAWEKNRTWFPAPLSELEGGVDLEPSYQDLYTNIQWQTEPAAINSCVARAWRRKDSISSDSFV